MGYFPRQLQLMISFPLQLPDLGFQPLGISCTFLQAQHVLKIMCIIFYLTDYIRRNYSNRCIFKIFYLFLERGEGREKKRERNINVWLPLTRPLLGTWPATQACALTGNRTRDPLVHRPAFNLLSHTSQGLYFLKMKMSLL